MGRRRLAQHHRAGGRGGVGAGAVDEVGERGELDAGPGVRDAGGPGTGGAGERDERLARGRLGIADRVPGEPSYRDGEPLRQTLSHAHPFAGEVCSAVHTLGHGQRRHRRSVSPRILHMHPPRASSGSGSTTGGVLVTSPVCQQEHVAGPRKAAGRARSLVRNAQRRRWPPSSRWGAVVLAVLAVHYAGDGRAGRVDRFLAELVPLHHGPAGAAGEALVALGDPVPVAVAMLVLAVLGWWGRGGRGWRWASLAAGGDGDHLARAEADRRAHPGPGAGLPQRPHHGRRVARGRRGAARAGLRPARTDARAGSRRARTARGGGGGEPRAGGYHYPTDVVAGLAVVAVVVPLAALTVDAFADLGETVLGETAGPDDDRTRRLPVLR